MGIEDSFLFNPMEIPEQESERYCTECIHFDKIKRVVIQQNEVVDHPTILYNCPEVSFWIVDIKNETPPCCNKYKHVFDKE